MLLEPFEDREHAIRANGLNEQKWSEIARLLDLHGYGIPSVDFKTMRLPPEPLIGDKTPSSFPKIVLIFPRKSLGNILTGTLNFSADYSHKSRAMGYEDGSEAIANYG